MRKQKKSILVLGTITVSLATALLLCSQILPASERFELVFDGKAVLDKQTGLIWERSPDTTKMHWSSARGYCSDKEVGGRKGWRLPTIEELLSLVDTNESNPALPSGHPFTNVQSRFYCSSFSDVAYPDIQYGVNFLYGKESSTFFEGNYVRVWCVLSGK